MDLRQADEKAALRRKVGESVRSARLCFVSGVKLECGLAGNYFVKCFWMLKQRDDWGYHDAEVRETYRSRGGELECRRGQVGPGTTKGRPCAMYVLWYQANASVGSKCEWCLVSNTVGLLLGWQLGVKAARAGPKIWGGWGLPRRIRRQGCGGVWVPMAAGICKSVAQSVNQPTRTTLKSSIMLIYYECALSFCILVLSNWSLYLVGQAFLQHGRQFGEYRHVLGCLT